MIFFTIKAKKITGFVQSSRFTLRHLRDFDDTLKIKYKKKGQKRDNPSGGYRYNPKYYNLYLCFNNTC